MTMTFGELIGGLMVLAAMGTVAYMTVGGSEQALGALIAVVAGGVGYFLRAKVQTPAP